MISLENLEVRYESYIALADFSYNFVAGNLYCLLGPNGAGKSTLLKAMIGSLPLKAGGISLHEKPLFAYSPKELARQIAYIPQQSVFQFDYSVREIVLMGRYPWLGFWESFGKKDEEIVDALLAKMGIEQFSHKKYNSLSGGEAQMVILTRALAQNAPCILLDEPFSGLDIRHQVNAAALVKKLCKTENKLAILITHDLNLAAEYADYCLFLKQGKLIAGGEPRTVINREVLKEVYELSLLTVQNPATGQPVVMYAEHEV